MVAQFDNGTMNQQSQVRSPPKPLQPAKNFAQALALAKTLEAGHSSGGRAGGSDGKALPRMPKVGSSVDMFHMI